MIARRRLTAPTSKPGATPVTRRIDWTTAGLLASTALASSVLAGGAHAAHGVDAVTVNWDALDAVGIGLGTEATVPGPIAPSGTFVPGTWPHSGAPNYAYMRLPRYYAGPVYTPLALTPYQPANRPVLGGDPIAAARTFAGTAAAIGGLTLDAPPRSTVEAPGTFATATTNPAIPPVFLASATFLQHAGGTDYVQYSDVVYWPIAPLQVAAADIGVVADWQAPVHATATTSSTASAADVHARARAYGYSHRDNSQTWLNQPGAGQPWQTSRRAPAPLAQLAQLAPAVSFTPPSMHDGMPVTAYNEAPYGQVVPESIQNPALPRRTFRALNAPTVRARIYTRQMTAADFMLPTAAFRLSAAGPRTRLGGPDRVPIPAVRQARMSQAAPPHAGSVLPCAPAVFASHGGLLDPPRRSPRSSVDYRTGPSGGGFFPGAPNAQPPNVQPSNAQPPSGQLLSRLEAGFGDATISSAGQGVAPAGTQIAGVPVQGPVIIAGATVARSAGQASVRRQVAAAPARQSRPTASNATATQSKAPQSPTPTPAPEPIATAPSSAASLAAAEPAPPPPPPPSDPTPNPIEPTDVVESPRVTGSTRAQDTTAITESAALPEMVVAPPEPPAPEPMPTPIPEPVLAAPASPEPTPLPEPASEPITAAPGTVPEPASQVPILTPSQAGDRVLGSISFPPGDPELSERARGSLAGIATQLAADETSRIQLNAYAADPEGNIAGARRLSLTRALAVRKFLIEQGIRSIRMDVRARGSNVEDGGPSERVDVILRAR